MSTFRRDQLMVEQPKWVVLHEDGTRHSGPLDLESARDLARIRNADLNRRQAHFGIKLTSPYYVAGALYTDRGDWGRA